MSTGQAGSLVTWTLIGAVLGGFVFGTLTDKYGRVRVLTWTIVLFAVLLDSVPLLKAIGPTYLPYNRWYWFRW